MKKLVLAMFIAVGLSACGGSSKAEPEYNAGSNTGISHTNSGINNNAGKMTGNANAGGGILAYAFSSQQQDAMEKINDASLMHVVVGGKRFDFAKANQSFGKNFKGNEAEGMVVSDAAWLKHVRVGVGVPNGQDGVNFVVGEVSKELPAAGAAQYVGRGILMAKHSDGFDAVSFAANVDFGGKTVRGKLGEISFDAKFSREGAEFKGSGVRGAFFGADASEMAGVYENKQQSGFFGAKKQ